MMNTTNNENAKPPTTFSSSSSNAAGISPVLYSSKPPATLVNSWNETRQVRAMLDQCRRDKAFVETQLSNEQIKTERLERENSELQADNAMLRAHLAAFEVENPLPPGWVSNCCYFPPSFSLLPQFLISSSHRSTIFLCSSAYFVRYPHNNNTQERIFSDSQQRYFYSHAATKHSQWHYPTASEVRDPAIAKMRVEQNQDAHNRRLS